MHRLFISLFFLCATSGVMGQDTLRYQHKFRLPVADNQSGYKKEVTQYPTNVHSFVFSVPDSCTVYIVVRSENDSLDIRIENTNTVIDLSAKQEGKYVYSFVSQLPRGEHVFVIRTRKYCNYSVYVKGQL